VIAPRRNEADLEEFPEVLCKDLEFVWVDRVDEVFEAALEGMLATTTPSER
jgi:ATP-dependent Lon protease